MSETRSLVSYSQVRRHAWPWYRYLPTVRDDVPVISILAIFSGWITALSYNTLWKNDCWDIFDLPRAMRTNSHVVADPQSHALKVNEQRGTEIDVLFTRVCHTILVCLVTCYITHTQRETLPYKPDMLRIRRAAFNSSTQSLGGDESRVLCDCARIPVLPFPRRGVRCKVQRL